MRWQRSPSVNKVALLDVDGDKVTYSKHDLLAGLYPYNVVISPNGSIALTADNGNSGSSDGNVDAVSVIDLTEPVHVIDHITVPDSPEGLAFSPKGNIAVTVDAYRFQSPQVGLVLSPAWLGDGAENRRQESDPIERHRGWRSAGGRRVHARWQVHLCRQLHG